MGDALHTHGGVTSAQEARVADAGLLAVQGPGRFDVRTGVAFGPGSTSLVSGTTTTAPNWTYQIAPHNWVSSRGAANGPYRGALEAATTVSTALPPASNSRIDVIWVKQGDATADVPSPDATTEPVYGVTSGAAAASPTKPAIPVGAVELATATVPSTATGGTAGTGVVITQTALQTVARGAAIPVRSQAERDALTAFDGLSVKRLDLGGVQEDYVSGAWVRVSLTDDTGWIALPLGSGWSAYGGVPTLQTPQYRRVKVGNVYEVMWRGVGKKSGVIANGETIATLPAGFRPPAGEVFNVMGNGPTAATGRLDVYADGTVKVMNAGFDGAYLSFAGIRYFTS